MTQLQRALRLLGEVRSRLPSRVNCPRQCKISEVFNEALLKASLQCLPPESRKKLQVYAAEADFFDSVLDNDFNSLAQGSHVIEIGSGIGLLALRAAARGIKVTAYEPQAPGFSEMLQHRDIIRKSWLGILPDVAWRDTFLNSKTLPPETERADFAFAINVLEHVPNVESFITNAMESLRPGGRFRFICPNYAFPYEPHFEIPTLIHKGTTFRAFQRRIRASTVEEPEATWQELSWPNVWKISRLLTRMNLRHTFSRSATEMYLHRVTHDRGFSARKGPAVRALFRLGSALAPAILTLTPTTLLPIIDCTIAREF